MTIWKVFKLWVRCLASGHDFVYYPQLYFTKCMRCKTYWNGRVD